MSYGYVHRRRSPQAAEGIVGFAERSAFFVAPNCGGAGQPMQLDVPLQLMDAQGAGPFGVRVQALGGHYVPGEDYEPLDAWVEFPPPVDGQSQAWIALQIHGQASCPFPLNEDNPAVMLGLSDSLNCDIGGTDIHLLVALGI
ncbi:hypothetical protein [Solimonas sp. SE-A11]|uniref:hypothetical protein n=1 Tax=Solimonas sp. SE-A11 TaxID=3054954 RepID=UPI00259CF222|nr:hypothetical protein [Solimonas sp. SE-A11]MDM4773064.1 hypothetical protein [Solimonas sp. SE-A11]